MCEKPCRKQATSEAKVISNQANFALNALLGITKYKFIQMERKLMLNWRMNLQLSELKNKFNLVYM